MMYHFGLRSILKVKETQN